MNINKDKNYNIVFGAILTLSSLFYIIYLIKIGQDFYWRYVYTDWLINYEGGFIKRGFLGQISIIFNNIFGIGLKNTFLAIHSFIYILFHYFFFLFFKDFKKNYLFLILCFSPLIFLYPLQVNDALARKEIFFITIFLINTYYLIKTKNTISAFVITNLSLIISCLIHEAVLFFSLFFYSSYYFFLKKNYLKSSNFINFLNIFIFILLLYVHSRPIDIDTLNDMIFFINNDLRLNITASSGAMSWLSKLTFKTSLLNPFKEFNPLGNIIFLKYISLHLLYMHFVLFFYYIIFKFSIFSNNRIIKILFVLNILYVFLLFYIAFDWGRFVYILYNFLLIFSFYILYENKNIFLKIDNETILKKLSVNFKLIFALIYISSWLPGLLYNDKFHLFPLFDFLIKNFFYIKKYLPSLLSL